MKLIKDCFSISLFKKRVQVFSKSLLLLAALPLTASAQIQYQVDMSFSGDGIATYSAPDNYFIHNTGCVLNNDGTVWYAGRVSDTVTSTINNYIGRYLSNGNSDTNFGINGQYGYQYPSTSSFIGTIIGLHSSINGGVFAPHSGYGGYCALSATAATCLEQIENFETNDVRFSESVNDSVVVVLDNTSHVYTYRSNHPTAGYTNQNYWFDGGTSFGGKLPTSVNNMVVSYYSMVAAQSSGKLVVTGHTATDKFIMRLKLHSFTTLDSTFGTNGVVMFSNTIYPGTNIDGITVDATDRILLSIGSTFRVTRLSADGIIDPTLGVSSYSGVPPIKIFTDDYDNIFLATEFAIYAFTNIGYPINSFHNGTNVYYSQDIDINIHGWAIRDFDMNAAGDMIVSGVIRKVPGGLHEAFVMKLKRGLCGLEIYANNITESSIKFDFVTAQYPVYIQLCDLGPLAGGEGGGAVCIYDTLTNLSGPSYTATGLLSNHNYSFTITNPNGCSLTTQAATLSTSIESVLVGLQMYPNPARQSLFLKSEEALASITIYNSMMQSVYTTDVISNEINIRTLPVGLYYARITASSGKQAIKAFVKE